MTLDFAPYAIDSFWLDPVPKPRTLGVESLWPEPQS